MIQARKAFGGRIPGAGGLALSVLLMACSGDNNVGLINHPPEVDFTSPAEMEVFLLYEPILLSAQVSDGESENVDLDISWGFSPEGEVSGLQSVDETTVSMDLPDGLESGTYTVGLLVVDPHGARDSDSVSFTVKENQSPVVNVLDPIDGKEFAEGMPVFVAVDVTDEDERNLHELVLEWGGVAEAATGAPEAPDSDGGAEFYLTDLLIGQYVISVTVTDSMGATDSDTAVFEIVEGDTDGDGFIDVDLGGDDCDDSDADIHPDADEYCDGLDNNCDGTTDEDSAIDAPTWYADLDLDGYGDPDVWVNACVLPAGYVADNTDCDDANPSTSPEGTEYCDGVDNDCDEVVDEDDAADASSWYLDGDSDGYGAAGVYTEACNQPSGYSADSTDCNDLDATISPGANEYCDGVDNNCDGVIDESTAVDALTWYFDGDEDGYGDINSNVAGCSAPSGYLADGSDCDDGDGAVNPGASEYCDSIDNDCDGIIDESDALDASTWYLDSDGDGFGDAQISSISCTAPSNYVADDTDCDDTAATVNSSELEYCDGFDNDCDDLVDEADAVDVSVWYTDADGDGYGVTATAEDSCYAPSGMVAAPDDCDDVDGAVNPGATELCDAIDNDCDGTTDEDDAADATTWYIDSDGDGYGDATDSQNACEQPSGRVEDATDCDDSAPTVSPGASEYCDGVDNDCDGTTDEDDAEDVIAWYTDTDGDGYGDSATANVACYGVTGEVSDGGDCDEADASINPGVSEICDGIDNNCDGSVDESTAVDATAWYTDADGDGYGDASDGEMSCDQITGRVADDSDCDDTDSSVNPGAVEYCDTINNDCDGETDESDSIDVTTWFSDSDGDGYGDATTGVPSCYAPSGTVAIPGDCDDTDAAVNPVGTEVCDGIDNNCDGLTDDSSAADAVIYFEDSDGDGYGLLSSFVVSCSQPSGWVTAPSDCDDGDASVYPGATEYCDGVDNDCDSSVDEGDAVDATTWYLDIDADGYGDASNSSVACSQPTSRVSDSTDCNDNDASINPGATEYCDGVDNDCDGDTDEDDAADVTTWYTDNDGDGFGQSGTGVDACSAPGATGWAADATDCDDAESAVNPDAVELCDSLDNDCDGTTDEDDAADASTWYLDGDTDGYGDPTNTSQSCSQPSGRVLDSSDCDDSDSAVNPGALEYCDGVDNDCDGSTDEDDAVDASTYYADFDGDGYGGSSYSVTSCTAPSGGVLNGSDCNDSDPSINPGATEYCDSVDNDCDGATDESDSADAQTWFLDSDGDGFGTSATSAVSCSAPSGYVGNDSDCDDGDSTASPDATEVCDSVDNDCDGDVDEDDAADATTYFSDADGDGYGDENTESRACTLPSGTILVGGDCDDTDSSVHPAAAETCDGVDNNCDGDIDGSDAVGTSTWYIDADGDGYGDPGTAQNACDQPTGYASNYTDCDDDNYAVHPAATEICGDFLDNNCDDSSGSCGVSGSIGLADAVSKWTGVVTFDYAGCAVADAGDVNGDGYDDILTGAYFNDDGGNQAGIAYLILGPVTGSYSLSAADTELVGESNNSKAGYAVSGLGDLDADGYDDLVIGAFEDGETGSTAGAAYVVYGPVAGSNSLASTGYKLLGESSGDNAGSAVAGAGDVDFDGYRDVLIGAPEVSNGRGRTYLILGPVSGDMDLGSADTIIESSTSNDRSGYAIDGGLDANGDGYSDILIGAYGVDDGAGGAGATFLFEGPLASGLLTLSSADAQLNGELNGDNSGWDVASAGDINADGYDDIVIGAPLYDYSSSNSTGAAYLVLGGVSGTVDLSVAAAKFIGESSGDRAGYSVDGLGDMEGDGYDDLVIGAPYANSKAGYTYVVYGPVSGTNFLANAAAVFEGEASNDFAGRSVSGAGDINNDGFRDILMGARGEGSAGNDAGALYMYLGEPRL